MTPALLTVNATGTSSIFTPDNAANPFDVGIGVNVTAGSSTVFWRIEHTFDNLNSPTATTVGINWFPNNAVGTSSTAGTTAVFLDMNYAFPVTGIRLQVMSALATTIVQASIIQAATTPS